MATSVTAVLSPSPKHLTSDFDDEEYEIVYEEVEVEVEEDTEVEDDGGVEAEHFVNGVEDENLTIRGEENLNNETSQYAPHDIDDEPPRLHASQIRLRDPLPSVEFDRESKKLRMMCEFHAKGWCVRGNSCMFLHIKHGTDARMKTSEHLAKEATPSSTCIPALQRGKNQKPNRDIEVLFHPKDGAFLGVASWEDKRSFMPNSHLASYGCCGTPPEKGGLSIRSNECLGNSSTMSHDDRVSGFGPKMDEIINKSNIGKSDTKLADLAHCTQSLPIGSLSWNNSVHGPNKFSLSSLEDHTYVTSTMQSSPSSRSELKTLSYDPIFKDAEPSKCEASFSYFDWEHFAPFIPSHKITRRILLEKGVCYPVRDSIDKNDAKDCPAKFSCSNEGSPIKNVNLQANKHEEEKLLVFANDVVKYNVLSSSNDEPRNITLLEVGSGKIGDVESKAVKYFNRPL